MKYFAGNDYTPAGWYLTREETIQYINMTIERFYSEMWDTLTKYRLPESPRTLFYLLADLEKKKGAP